MDNGEIIKIAQEYIHSVSTRFALEKAILFGSFARGNPQPNSDIDIALVFHGKGDMLQAQIDLLKLRRNIDLRIEPHPFTIDDFNASNPVVNEIMKYGIELHQNSSLAAEPKGKYGKK